MNIRSLNLFCGMFFLCGLILFQTPIVKAQTSDDLDLDNNGSIDHQDIFDLFEQGPENNPLGDREWMFLMSNNSWMQPTIPPTETSFTPTPTPETPFTPTVTFTPTEPQETATPTASMAY